MKNEGKIFAFERDRKRFQTLRMMLARAATKNVEPVNANFLSINPSDYAHVSHMSVNCLNTPKLHLMPSF
jgi:putative methyltransferase